MNPSSLIGIERIEVVILIGFVVFYVVLPLWAMRQGIVHALSRGSVALLACLILRAILASHGFNLQQAGLAGLLVGAAAYLLFPSRSRHIPTTVRRRVVARDLKGRKFDSRKHHIDHRWPFARGGSHTTDNLRVLSKGENLRKGKKRPRLKDWL